MCIRDRFTEDGLSFIKQKLIESGMISADKIVMEDGLWLEIYNVKSSMDEIHFVAQGLKSLIKRILRLIEWITDFGVKN